MGGWKRFLMNVDKIINVQCTSCKKKGKFTPTKDNQSVEGWCWLAERDDTGVMHYHFCNECRKLGYEKMCDTINRLDK